MKEFINKLISEGTEISSRRVIGFSSFIFLVFAWITKVVLDVVLESSVIEMEMLYIWTGLIASALFSTAFKGFNFKKKE